MINKFSQIMESSSKPVKIGLDLHGVIDSMPEFFAFFTMAIIKAGGEIHIITGGTTEKDIQLLKDNNIQWTHFFSITDYHNKKGTPTSGTHPKYGFPMISDEEWDKTKGDYCRRERIELHIDDTLVYNDYFTTPFCRLWSNNNHPKSDAKDSRHLL
jgi:hypothetical protein